jgi:hypothetical protein
MVPGGRDQVFEALMYAAKRLIRVLPWTGKNEGEGNAPPEGRASPVQGWLGGAVATPFRHGPRHFFGFGIAPGA